MVCEKGCGVLTEGMKSVGEPPKEGTSQGGYRSLLYKLSGTTCRDRILSRCGGLVSLGTRPSELKLADGTDGAAKLLKVWWLYPRDSWIQSHTSHARCAQSLLPRGVGVRKVLLSSVATSEASTCYTRDF